MLARERHQPEHASVAELGDQGAVAVEDRCRELALAGRPRVDGDRAGAQIEAEPAGVGDERGHIGRRPLDQRAEQGPP